jgi:ribose transport system permease protein
MSPDAAAGAATSLRPSLTRFRRRAVSTVGNYVGVLTVLAGLIVFFSLSQSQFFTYDNFLTILETNAVLLVVSVGLTFTLLVGGFDLSIGGVLALSGVLLAKTIQDGWPLPLSIAVCVAGGVLFGAVVTGFPISKLGVNFFVVTLGAAFAARGIALVITDGASQGLYEESSLRQIGGGRVGSIPIPVLIALGILVAALVVTRYTGFGRMIYAVGGNTEAARLAGINVVGVRLAAYAISAGLAAWAGVMEAGRLAAAAPDTDTGIEFTAAAAVLLGGTSFVGGYGGMFGTFLGVVFLGVLQNGVIIAGISAYWQNVVTGGVLIASVLIDWVRRRQIESGGWAAAARRRRARRQPAEAEAGEPA